MFEGIVDSVWVLSLPDADERRARLPGHLAKFGIKDFEWHDAYGPEDAPVRAMFDDGKVTRFPPCFRCGQMQCECSNNVLIPPQVANFASFIEIWRAVAATPQVALVLEDDVKFHPWARRGMRMVRRNIRAGTLPLRPDVPFMLRLGWPHNDDHKWSPFFRLKDRVRMSNPCHIVTSAFAQTLLDRFDSVKNTSDMYIHRDAPKAGEAMTLFPPIATELSFALGAVESSIHPKEAYVATLRAKGREEEARAQETRIRRHIKRLYHRPLLILGHPRTGTKFAAELCGQLGLEVGHENDGKDGISSWMCAVDADENPWTKSDAARTRRALDWRHMIQVVRDPSAAVPSIMRENAHAPDSYAFRREHILAAKGTDLDSFPSEIDRAVASLCLWNQIIRAQNPDFVFHIERDHGAMAAFLAQNGYEISEQAELDLSPVNQNKKYRSVVYEKPEVSGADWHGLSAPAQALLQDYCQTYDYPDPVTEA